MNGSVKITERYTLKRVGTAVRLDWTTTEGKALWPAKIPNKGAPVMNPITRHLNPWIPLLVGALIIFGATIGMATDNGMLLTVALLAFLLLVLAYVLLDIAYLLAIEGVVARLRTEADVAGRRTDEAEAEVALLRDALADHVARCQTHDLDRALVEIARPRSVRGA